MTGRSVAAQTSRSSCRFGPLEHPVLVDVGDHVARAALGVEAGQHVVEVAAVAGPAARGQGAPAHVEADRDPVAVLGDHPGAPLGLLERGRADVDPPAAGGQRRLEGLVVADAAAHLDLDVEGADDLGLQLAVAAAPEGGVEVDEVQPLGAGVLPARAAATGSPYTRLGAGHALDELDGPALGDVDGGQQLEVVAHGTSRVGPDASGRRVATQLRSSAGAGVAGLLGVELGGPQRAVLDGRDEPVAAVLAPGDQRRAGCGRWSPAASRARRRSARSRTARRPRPANSAEPSGDLDGVPAHVRDDRRLEPLDHPGHSSQPGSRHRARPRARRAPACPRRCRAPDGRRPADARSAGRP